MKILTSIILVLFAQMVKGETIQYSDKMRHVDLRSTSPSLLMFPAPVISVACQPAWVTFETLTQDRLSVQEQNQLEARSLREAEGESSELLGRMLRARPLRQHGHSQCSFVLSNADEVPVKLRLVENLARPYIEFIPFSTPERHGDSDKNLIILAALMEGKPMDLEMRNENQVCRKQKGYSPCRNKVFATDMATYEVKLLAKNASVSAWIVAAELKQDITFEKAADLNASYGIVRFSMTLPQRPSFKKHDTVRHHIIAQPNMTVGDLEGILP